MPHPLSLELIDYDARDAKTKHRSIVFFGLYCIESPESEHWRVRFGEHKLGVKVGKSIDILRRLNEYLLYFPLSIMYASRANQDTKKQHGSHESFVLRELKKEVSCGTELAGY